MNVVVFSCIDFDLTSIKQTGLNKQGSTHKLHVIIDWYTFSAEPNVGCFYFSMWVWTSANKIYTLHLLSQDELTSNDLNSRWLMYHSMFV